MSKRRKANTVNRMEIFHKDARLGRAIPVVRFFHCRYRILSKARTASATSKRCGGKKPERRPRCCSKATLHRFLHLRPFRPLFSTWIAAPRSLDRRGQRWANEAVGGRAPADPTSRAGAPLAAAPAVAPSRPSPGTMLHIKIRWGDLGSPVERHLSLWTACSRSHAGRH